MNSTIQKLAKALDVKIEAAASISYYENEYTTDEKGNVIGISLWDVQLKGLDKLLPFAEYLTDIYIIECNNFRELSSLSQFKALKKLALRYNPIPHSEMKHLLSLNILTHLEISGTKIEETTMLSELSTLEYLDIGCSSSLPQVDGLEKLSRLKYLDCSGINYLSLEPIAGHNGISHLIANCSECESMTGIERFPNLTYLNLSSTSIQQISGLENLRGLKHLDISCSNLNKISGLEQLENLENLELGYSKLTKIEGLETLKNLKSLDLARCCISKIEGLDTLVNLSKLELRENEISKVENLSNLVNLEYFNVEMNKIKAIDAQFLLNIRKPCEIYLGSDTLKEKGLAINVPKHVSVCF